MALQPSKHYLKLDSTALHVRGMLSSGSLPGTFGARLVQQASPASQSWGAACWLVVTADPLGDLETKASGPEHPSLTLGAPFPQG